MKIGIINGPNLNLLGKRQVDIYGDQSFESYLESLASTFPNIAFDYFQSNHEGGIIDKLHAIGFEYDGIILNAGAYTHTSIAIADAIATIEAPVFEVHISDVFNREDFRKHSFISPLCAGIITGQGLDGYRQAVEFFNSGSKAQ